jgi:hypothetical protein
MANYTGFLDSLWWSPEEYAQLAQDLTTKGAKYEECINAATEAITALGTNGQWTGYLYNQLIQKFNENVASLNEDATLLAETIPTKISNQAQEQASANNGTIQSVSLASLAGILSGSETEDDGTGSVYIDADAVNAGVTTFSENIVEANNIANQYLDLFSSTIANGLNVSSDIKAMESEIQRVIDDLFSFNEKFKDLLEQCAYDSATIMMKAKEASEAEAQNIDAE